MDKTEYKRQIIKAIEHMDEADRKFLRQILTLIRMYMEETGRG